MSGLALAAGLSLAAPGLAQDRPVDTPENLIEQEQPVGFRIGTIQAYPSGSADLRYDSNIYNRSQAIQKGMIAVVRPAIRLETNWPRHRFSLGVGAEVRRYFDQPTENSEQFALSPELRLDLGERLTFAPSVRYARRIERRGSAGDVFFTDEPIRYQETSAGVTLARSGGMLGLSASARTTSRRYDDATLGGAPVEMAFRDVTQNSLGVRADYSRGGRLGLFASGSYDETRYRLNAGPRNSAGGSFLAGVTYRLSQVSSIEAGLGYIHRKFDNPLTGNLGGLNYWINADWTPMPRLRLVAKGQRSVERSPLQIAPAVVESYLAAEATYALGSRLLVGLSGQYTREDFRGIDRRDRRYIAEMQTRYRINRFLGAFAGLGYRQQASQGTLSRSYDGITARAGVRFTP